MLGALWKKLMAHLSPKDASSLIQQNGTMESDPLPQCFDALPQGSGGNDFPKVAETDLFDQVAVAQKESSAVDEIIMTDSQAESMGLYPVLSENSKAVSLTVAAVKRGKRSTKARLPTPTRRTKAVAKLKVKKSSKRISPRTSKQVAFTKSEIAPVFDRLRDAIKGGAWGGLDEKLLASLTPSRVVVAHGTDSRVLEYIITVKGQVFDKRYLKIVVQHDPVPRYKGTKSTNWAVLFWVNRIRGAYQHREEIMARFRRSLRGLKVPRFAFEEDEQMLSYIARFKGSTLQQVERSVNALLPNLIEAVFPTYADVIGAFSSDVSETGRKRIIARTKRPKGLNRFGQGFGMDTRFSHSIPRAMRMEVYQRDMGRCVFCEKKVPKTRFHVDHIKPHSKGGLTVLRNLQVLCPACNLSKGNRE